MAVCRFYQQGNCKFGDKCRYDHPGRNAPAAERNPFAPLQSPANNRSGNTSGARESQNLPFSISKAGITQDLLNERPQWILSSYSPGRDTPTQLFGGHPREQSFEEMRVQHYRLAAQGTQNQAISEAQDLVKNAETQIQTALQDVDGAIKYLLDGEHQHPNRIDICRAKGNVDQQQGQSVFGAPAQTPFQSTGPSSTFGQPSLPTSHQPLAQGPTFGQPSSSQPSFGQPAFGQPSFGQPSTFARPSSGTAFGAASSSTPNSGFNASNTSTSPFQQSSIPPKSSFGQPSNLNQTSPFSTISSNSKFGSTTPDVSQTQSAPSNPFSSSQPFGSQSQNSFGSKAANAFGQNSAAPNNAGMSQPTMNSQSGITIKPTSTASIQKDGSGRLQTWNGMNVTYLDEGPCYKGRDGNWHRIWFPDGAPSFRNTIQVPDDMYDSFTQEKYMSLRSAASFQDGLIPLVPPKKDWCEWNL